MRSRTAARPPALIGVASLKAFLVAATIPGRGAASLWRERNPQSIGTLPVAGGDALSVATSGGRAFLAAGRAGLVAIDVTNPVTPQVLDVAPSLADGLGVAASGSHVFVAGGPGFAVIDAASPERPRHVAVAGPGGNEFGTYIAVSS